MAPWMAAGGPAGCPPDASRCGSAAFASFRARMSLPPVSSQPSVQEYPEREDRPLRAAPALTGARAHSGPRISFRARWAIVAVVCIAIAGGSLIVQNAADFDPWGWIVWGREVLHLHLSTS